MENEKENIGNYKLLKAELKHLKEINKKTDKARKLQAKEYKRRLKELNGEAARLRSMQETYAPREVYEAKVKEIEEKHERKVQEIESVYRELIEKTITPMQAWQNNMQGRMAIILLIWTAVIGFVFYLLTKK
jgi:hypothetical protein